MCFILLLTIFLQLGALGHDDLDDLETKLKSLGVNALPNIQKSTLKPSILFVYCLLMVGGSVVAK